MPPAATIPTIGTGFAVPYAGYGVSNTEITALTNGTFVAAWVSSVPDPINGPIAVVRFVVMNEAGALLASGNVQGTNPSVAATAGGGFMASWVRGGDIYLQRFGPDAVALAAEVNVDTAPSVTQSDPDLAVLASGDAVLVYTEGNDVKLRRFDANGNEVGTEVTAHSFADGTQRDATVTALADGGFVVVWEDNRGNTSGDYYLAARKFDASFNPVGSEFVVNTTTAGTQQDVAVAVLASGGFVAVWAHATSDIDVRGQVFDANGVKVGGEFEVASGTGSHQSAPDVAAYPGGGFVVTWVDSMGNDEIKARVFGDDGTPVAAEFQVNPPHYLDQGAPQVAVLPTGTIEFIWSDPSRGPSVGGQAIILGFDQTGLVGTHVGSTRDDLLYGGALANDLTGNQGDDLLYGGGGDDILRGGLGTRDQLYGGDGSDTVSYQGDSSAVTINLIIGEGAGASATGDFYTGIENVVGTSFNDALLGNAEINRLEGGDGHDQLTGGYGADVLVGGDGVDTARYDDVAKSVFINLYIGQGFGNHADGDTFSGVENVIGSALDDYLIGDDGVNGLVGSGGNDVLIGGEGADVLDGGIGSDTVSYEDRAKAVFVNLYLGQGFNNSAQGDVYTSIENAIGSSLADYLIGSDGANRLDGRDGDDVLIGGLGGDALVGGNGIDTASYEDQQGGVFVNLGLDVGASNAAQGDTFSSIENVTGTMYADVLIGDAGVNRLDGGDGNDILIGGLEADVLIGGAGTDTVSYADNWGAVFVNLALNLGASNAAQGDSYSSIENATGSAFADYLLGDDAPNVLAGGGGNDTIYGRGGADVFLFDTPVGVGNVDTLMDFQPSYDRILLESSIFNLTEGDLGPNMFLVGSAATGGSNRIIYNQATGELFYDDDGNGSDPAVLFAILEDRPTLTAGDFLVV